MIIDSLVPVSGISKPVVMSIGNFDGVHLGHQAIIRCMRQTAQQENAPTAIVTFKNHPSQILRPYHAASLLTSPEQKTALLQKFGVDIVMMLTFDHDFANQTAEIFIQKLMHALPFRHLVLGYDAKLGKERQGDKAVLEALGKKLGFTLEIVEPLLADGQPVSSSAIRMALQNDDFASAVAMLGRKYSIFATVIKGEGTGKTIGVPTANCEVHGLCLPSFGVYAVTVLFQGQKLPGVANLGFAPTVLPRHVPLLEVHIFDQKINLYGCTIEVVFEEFIRQEIRFPSIEQLKEQIRQDIETAKKILDFNFQKDEKSPTNTPWIMRSSAFKICAADCRRLPSSRT